MWMVALAIVLAGLWISNSIDDLSEATDQLNYSVERLISDLQSSEDE